jgi:hypothetical protein
MAISYNREVVLILQRNSVSSFCHHSLIYLYFFSSLKYTGNFKHGGPIEGDISAALLREERGKRIEAVGDGCVLPSSRNEYDKYCSLHTALVSVMPTVELMTESKYHKCDLFFIYLHIVHVCTTLFCCTDESRTG